MAEPKAPSHESHRPLPHRLPITFRHASAATAVVLATALLVGIAGYRFIAGFEWVDSLLEASMILTGMGPVAKLPSTAAKIFASGYALFSGTIFLVATGIIVSPVVHRVLHRFHLERDEK